MLLPTRAVRSLLAIDTIMRIAIDARLNHYRRGGIPQYTRQLLTALAEVAPNDHFISLQHRDMARPLQVAANVSRRTIYTPPHHRWENWSLPLELVLSRPDVLHSPDFIAPLQRTFPAVVTIHDLAFMHYPDILDDDAKRYYAQVRESANRAQGIIAVSEATRQDIVQFLDIPPEDITVVYEAAAPQFHKRDLRRGEARVLNGRPVAEQTFMLFVSTLEPRKNLPTLLQGLRIAIDRRPHVPYHLVIVGGRGWKDAPIFQAVRDLRLNDHVLFAGNVGLYDLRWLYNACRFYLNPSLYEGFGLPLLEAMACGAPALVAATSSLPEIGGDAAQYVPPLEPDAWADAIADLWEDDDRRNELSRLGRARAQRFSWNRAARETMAVYQRATQRAERVTAPSIPALAGSPEPEFDGIDAPRRCLRCNTAMVPGAFQSNIAIRMPDDALWPDPLAPRAWACPRCHYTELVLEPVNAAEQSQQVQEPRTEPAPAADVPVAIAEPAAPLMNAEGEPAPVAGAPASTDEELAGQPVQTPDVTDTPYAAQAPASDDLLPPGEVLAEPVDVDDAPQSVSEALLDAGWEPAVEPVQPPELTPAAPALADTLNAPPVLPVAETLALDATPEPVASEGPDAPTAAVISQPEHHHERLAPEQEPHTNGHADSDTDDVTDDGEAVAAGTRARQSRNRSRRKRTTS